MGVGDAAGNGLGAGGVDGRDSVRGKRKHEKTFQDG
jgi:hypothetical protein